MYEDHARDTLFPKAPVGEVDFLHFGRGGLGTRLHLAHPRPAPVKEATVARGLRGDGRLGRPQGAADRRGHDAALVHRRGRDRVSFGGGEAFGLFIRLALAVHNIPEGLAISLVLVPRGTGVGRVVIWSIFSSLPQPLMAVPAFLFVGLFEPLLPIGLGFAGGAMIWMVFSELVPDALEETNSSAAAVVVTLSVAAMVAFQYLIR